MSDRPPEDPKDWSEWNCLSATQQRWLLYQQCGGCPPPPPPPTKKRPREEEEGPGEDEPPAKRRKKGSGWRTSVRRQKLEVARREKKEEGVETCTECKVRFIGVGNPDRPIRLGTYDVMQAMYVERYTRCPKHKNCRGRLPRPVPFPETPSERHRRETAEYKRKRRAREKPPLIVDDDDDPLPTTRVERERETEGHACPECKPFYEALGQPGLANECSRHRHRRGAEHVEGQTTPERYWELSFFDEDGEKDG